MGMRKEQYRDKFNRTFRTTEFRDGKRKAKDDIIGSSLARLEWMITSTEPVFTNRCIPNAQHSALAMKNLL